MKMKMSETAEQIALDLERFATHMFIGNDLAEDILAGRLKSEAVYELHLDGWRTMVYGLLPVDKLGYERIVYPATWVDAFKVAHFPKWLRKRFPAKFRTYEFDLRAIYDARVQVPEYGPKVYINRWRNEYTEGVEDA